MPNYDYECAHGHVTEHRCSIADKPETISCATCEEPAKFVILGAPFLNNTEVCILSYPGSKALKAGYVHSHGDKRATKIQSGYGGCQSPNTVKNREDEITPWVKPDSPLTRTPQQ